MALVKNNTKISLDSTKKPDGFTDPGGSNLASSEPTYTNIAISVLKATVENATKSTTFDNILTDVVVGIEKQIADLLTNDMDITQTITYNIDWKNIKNNQDFSNEFYSDVANSYVATVDVYINVS